MITIKFYFKKAKHFTIIKCFGFLPISIKKVEVSK